MTYDFAISSARIDQGDLINGCPILRLDRFDLASPSQSEMTVVLTRVVILTQTCDLDNQKTERALVAESLDAQEFVDQGIFKPSDIRGSLRAGRIWGVYFLPADATLGLNEMIVDLRRVHTVRLGVLRDLCLAGHRLARIKPLYREHLAKHFADTYSRIGLPRPYETM